MPEIGERIANAIADAKSGKFDKRNQPDQAKPAKQAKSKPQPKAQDAPKRDKKAAKATSAKPTAKSEASSEPVEVKAQPAAALRIKRRPAASLRVDAQLAAKKNQLTTTNNPQPPDLKKPGGFFLCSCFVSQLARRVGKYALDRLHVSNDETRSSAILLGPGRFPRSLVASIKGARQKKLWLASYSTDRSGNLSIAARKVAMSIWL